MKNGRLAAMETASIASLVTPVSIAVDSSGKYIYVTNISSNDVSQYKIGASGELAVNPRNKWGDYTIHAEVSPRSLITSGLPKM
jgi:6-phosphogluconolactonase (cycloisomerase 2 family)